MSGVNGVAIVLVILFLFIMMLILKCCFDSRNTPKVTRRPHSYQNIPDNTVTVVNTATAPPQDRILTRIDSDDIDGIVIVPYPNQASPVVVPPYPVEPRHPTPQAAPPAPGFATHNPPYPTQTPHPVPGAAPYPPVTGPAPYPPVTGVTPYPPVAPHVGTSAPYPPDYSAHPPSYTEAVSQPPLTKEAYSKQAPYNPNY